MPGVKYTPAKDRFVWKLTRRPKGKWYTAEPIITPTTRLCWHDEDISRAEILKLNIVSADDYAKLEAYTKAVFKRGTEIAAKQDWSWLYQIRVW